jgi:c-di-AMP phosphodiesterase-like protein
VFEKANDMRKFLLYPFLSLLILFIFFLVLAFFYHNIWSEALFLFLLGLLLFIFLRIFLQELPKRKAALEEIEEIEKVKKEQQKMIKSLLRVSILFWVHYYKKEKMLSMEDAKKRLFKSLEKEFSHIPWMTDLLIQIQKELFISLKNPSDLD